MTVKCLRCKTDLRVTETASPRMTERYSAWCPNCYDPAPDAGFWAHLCGFGPQPEAALFEWLEQAADLADSEDSQGS